MRITRPLGCVLVIALFTACRTRPDASKLNADPDAPRADVQGQSTERALEPGPVCEPGPIKPVAAAQMGRYRVRGFTADRTRLHFFLEAKAGAGQNTLEVQAASPALAELLLRNEGTQQMLELGIVEREGCVGEVVFVRSQ